MDPTHFEKAFTPVISLSVPDFALQWWWNT